MIKQYYLNLKYGIENLCKWFKIIFQDRDWDQYFIYAILRFKLKNMIRHFQKYGHAENNDVTIRYMRICVKLLDKIIYDDFNSMFTKGMIRKVDWIPCDASEELFELKINYNVPKEEYKNAVEKGEELRKKYRKTLFSVLEKRIERFWD